MTILNTTQTIDESFVQQARTRLDHLTKPQGSLGRLEDIAAWVCGWQRTLTPRTHNAHTLIFAGNHGVAAQGVSAFPAEVTAQMVDNFSRGGAAINQLCQAVPSSLHVIPLMLETPTQDFSTAPAMNESECADAFNTGANAVPKDADIVIIGEMGIANTTSAAALAYGLFGGHAALWVGRGTGIDDARLTHKCDVVEKAYALHAAYLGSTMALLSRLGGREMAAMAGAVARARDLRIPVILDGYVATAAAATLTRDHPAALAHCISGHVSAEPGHRLLLEKLDMLPLLQLNMRLGEGSGAQIALAIVRASIAAFTGMATFESASVSGKHDEP
jgi:nicotinate-nucleotide--dimethylbenzimidazole phosphoribosyltransferase